VFSITVCSLIEVLLYHNSKSHFLKCLVNFHGQYYFLSFSMYRHDLEVIAVIKFNSYNIFLNNFLIPIY